MRAHTQTHKHWKRIQREMVPERDAVKRLAVMQHMARIMLCRDKLSTQVGAIQYELSLDNNPLGLLHHAGSSYRHS